MAPALMRLGEIVAFWPCLKAPKALVSVAHDFLIEMFIVLRVPGFPLDPIASAAGCYHCSPNSTRLLS